MLTSYYPPRRQLTDCPGAPIQINCTGQKPASGVIAELAPHTLTESGHIRVKPTLQIDDDSLPNVYVSGDVAGAHARNPNSRIAARQGEIAADNIVLAIRGKAPSRTYKEEWGDEVIKLTLGLVSWGMAVVRSTNCSRS